MNLEDINGVVPILPTPFNKDETVDILGYEKLMFFAKAAGCKSVGLPAFGSEYYKLATAERNRILDAAFEYANSLSIIVQCNHTSPEIVRILIKNAERRGATAISTLLPRRFPVSEEQLFGFASIVCSSTELPVIIQDFNPAGSVIGLDFVKRLSDKFENFKFIKFELSGVGSLIKHISEATNDKVRVFSGWGGSYMMEQIPSGIVGIMPGIPLADYFIEIWNKSSLGKTTEAMKMFSAISPYIAFSLQNLEMFHHAEKRLAVRRGIIKSAVVRSVSITLDDFQERYLESLLDQICFTIEQYGLKLN